MLFMWLSLQHPFRILTNAVEKIRINMLVGYNDDDEFWIKNAAVLRTSIPFHLHFSYQFQPLPTVVREGKVTTSMVNITNTLVQRAIEMGADYVVRVNDDTEFLSSGWLSECIDRLQGFDPPNVGVVGPVSHGDAKDILTHDMIHKTHMEIFKTYWPTFFVNWFGDTWMTQTYKNTDKISIVQDWVVRHNTDVHGTRYKPFQPSMSTFQQLVTAGESAIKKYVSYQGEKFEPVFIE